MPVLGIPIHVELQVASLVNTTLNSRGKRRGGLLYTHTLFPVTEFLLPLCRHLLFKYTPKYIHNGEACGKLSSVELLEGISYLPSYP